MAKPPQTNTINLESIPDAPEWFQKVVPMLNDHFSDVSNALTGQLTVGENIAAQVITISVTTDGAGQPSPTITYTNGLTTKPFEVRVSQVVPQSSGGSVTGAVTCPWWEYTERGQVQIRLLTGLAANQKYSITFTSH